MRETWAPSLGWEDPLEKGKAIHSTILAWRIPWLYSPWGRKKSVTTKWLSLHLEKNGKFTTELLLGFIYFYFYLLLPKSFLCIFQHYAKIFLVIGSHAMGLILGETVYLGIKESARLEAQGLWRQSWRRKLFCHFRGGHVFPLCPFSFKKKYLFFFIWLHWVFQLSGSFTAAHGLSSSSMWAQHHAGSRAHRLQ